MSVIVINNFITQASGGGAADTTTQFLCHMEGTDEGTTFTDDGLGGNTITSVGGANTEADQSKFGSTSLQTTYSSDYLSLTDSSDFNLGLSNEHFTLEFFARVASASALNLFTGRGGGTPGWNSTYGNQWLLFTQSSTLYWQFWNGSSVQTISASVASVGMSANTWYHFAITYDGTTTSAYFNGTRFGTRNASYVQPVYSTTTRIGAAASGYGLNGFVDEFRIKKGVGASIYSGSSLTVPTAAFTNP